MSRLSDNKIIVVTRPTRLAELVTRFNTVSQARFYIEHQGADFSDYSREDQTYHHALAEAQKALSQIGRVQTVDRGFLPNFVFGPDDTIVTLGQDGLVANTLKYLNGQPVIGVNPDPARWDGKLLRFKIEELAAVVPEVMAHRRPTKTVTMAKASLNNGQTLYAVNDLFIGPRSHTSVRYTIQSGDAREPQSSSGVIVSTGMGSTGWLKSLLTGAAAVTQSAGSVRARQFGDSLSSAGAGNRGQNRNVRFEIKSEFAWDANCLFFTVREPFPTQTTGASLVFGTVTDQTPLRLQSQTAENGVIFSDGIEKDFLEFNSGAEAVISIAERKGILVQ
jgi:NAD kinase